MFVIFTRGLPCAAPSLRSSASMACHPSHVTTCTPRSCMPPCFVSPGPLACLCFTGCGLHHSQPCHTRLKQSPVCDATGVLPDARVWNVGVQPACALYSVCKPYTPSCPGLQHGTAMPCGLMCVCGIFASCMCSAPNWGVASLRRVLCGWPALVC